MTASPKDDDRRTPDGASSKQPWSPMTATYVCNIDDIVQGGPGKTGPNTFDGNDPGKPPGQG